MPQPPAVLRVSKAFVHESASSELISIENGSAGVVPPACMWTRAVFAHRDASCPPAGLWAPEGPPGGGHGLPEKS